MEFKSLKNIESSFRQIRLFGIVFLAVRRDNGVERVELLPFRREATGEDLCAGQRQVADARLVSGFCRRTVRRRQGTRAPFPRDVLHAIAEKERD